MLINIEIKEPTEFAIHKTEELIKKYNREHLTVNFIFKNLCRCSYFFSINRFGGRDIYKTHKN